ncbi:MBL fold metallo-hydrolase [Leptolyngbya ohadii]|uniref:MBL fold metallo-hydrolase n=1 Tax=Leptolyngbya ohadii TaxID=1962290 RepID=UPI000B59E15E|nr:MBL fold metallo-hydrolase [Leptolyngbya ohadii]
MYLTWLNSNSWLIEMAGQKILLDPWLVGSLVFGNLSWLIKIDRLSELPIPDAIDLILLSQGLEDHAHPETLEQLDRQIPVVASPNAAKVVNRLGYQQVTALAHGESFTLANRLKIQAVPGSLVGPTLVENGYVLTDLQQGTSLYYEPHGNHAPMLKDLAPIDVVIAPIVDLQLPVVGAIIRGRKATVELAKLLKPKVILPTAAGGDVEMTGFLPKFLKAEGTAAELQSRLAAAQLTTQVIEPKPGSRFEVAVA